MSWRQRLSRALAYPSPQRGREYLQEVALPALREVAGELQQQGVDAEAEAVQEDGVDGVELRARSGDDEHPFRYRVWPREVPVPAYGRAAQVGHDYYVRLEVHLSSGGQGYDVMGYTHTQLIDDVLDQYERHLEFLRLQHTTGADDHHNRR
jgi:choline/glycine/proline betaine transport protein